jgi:hypothetical protein
LYLLVLKAQSRAVGYFYLTATPCMASSTP